MEADLSGKLILNEGCLRLEASNVVADYFLIWPPDFKPRRQNGLIEILDGSDQVVGRVGDEIRTGGSEVPVSHVSQEIRNTCPGPYFEVGDWHGPIEE